MRIQVRVLTPDRIFRREEVEELIIPTITGQVGVLNGHAPLITALDIGPMILCKKSKWTAIALMGGFALVQENRLSGATEVIILVNEAVSASSVDAKEAERALTESITRLNQVSEGKAKAVAAFSFKRARARYQIATWKSLFTINFLFIFYFIMSKYRGPRLRIIRRIGDLPTFTQKNLNRNTYPGQHGITRKKTTQFAHRLLEKQKLRFHYGISEKQLVRYVTMLEN